MNVAWGRWAAASGIVFAILFVAGILLAPVNLPDGTDQEVLDFYAGSGDTLVVLIGGYVLVAAGIAYAVFLVELSSRLPRLDRGSRNWATLSVFSGAAFVVLLLVAAALFASISGDIKFGGDPTPVAVAAARYLPEAGFPVLMIAGAVAVAVHIVSTSLAAGPALFPKWLSWASLVFAVLLLFAVLLFPLILLPVWAIIVSVVLLRKPVPAV